MRTSIGVCLPNRCSSGSIKYLTEQITATNSSSINIECYDEHVRKSIHYSVYAIGIVVLTLIVLGSFCRALRLKTLSSIVLPFSVAHNLKLLRSARDSYLRTRLDLSPIDGFKVLTMLWIIVIHSYNFSMQWLHYDNAAEVASVYATIWTQWIANGTFSVDNFLIASGLLSSIRFYKTQPENVPASLSKRYFRLAPPTVLCIIISINLLQYWSCGPNWSNATMMFDLWCRKNWPVNLLMLQNYVNTSNMCYSHTWFISVEMQLFLAIRLLQSLCFPVTSFESKLKRKPNALYFLREMRAKLAIRRKYFLMVLTLFSISGQILAASIIYMQDLPPMPLLPTTPMAMNEYYSRVYIKPFYWFSSYVMGVVLGEFILTESVKNMPAQTRLSHSGTTRNSARDLLNILPNICALVALATLWSCSAHFRSRKPMSNLTAAIYSFLARPIWSMCMVVILKRLVLKQPEQCTWLRGLRGLLSLKIWRTFSRLNLGAYLLHPVIMAVFYGSRNESFNMTPALMFYYSVGNIVATYIAALLFFLVIESPASQIFKSLLEK